MSKFKKVMVMILVLSIFVMIGLSVWLGFPCDGFNRLPILLIGYLLSFIGFFASIACIVEGGDS